MPVTLSYDDKASAFIEANKSDSAAKLVLAVEEKGGVAKLTFSGDAGLIARRTASRQAESVCKSGFLLKSGERVGIGMKLEVVEGDKISDVHLREGHKFNRY